MSERDFFTIFIFPFKYVSGDNSKITPDEVVKKYSNENDDPEEGWKREDYFIDRYENYNEYYYFHPFVRKAIFNRKGHTGIKYLTRKDYKRMEVEYFYEDKDKSVKKGVMVTDIKSIDLHLFENQIGLLTITTERCPDDNETGFDDLLRYNDIARRVYPPYLTEDKKDNTLGVKKGSRLLPARITIFNANDDDLNISECFEHLNLKREDDREVIYMSRVIRGLLLPRKRLKERNTSKDEICFIPFTDDRMFTISYYADKELSARLTQRCCGMYRYELPHDELSDYWYRFIFVDGNFKNIQNPDMQRELIKRHTYSRWADWGTLYGFSRYSMVMVGDNGDFCRKVLKQHMKSLYYQIALIVLFQRAMLLKFSDDIADLLEDIHGKSLPELREGINRLHGDFVKFINKYWFVEVTPQEQGIEMYNQWMTLVGTEKLYKEVSQEVRELSEYLENKTESETNRRLAIITIVGVVIAVLGLIIGFWEVYERYLSEFTSIPELFTLFSFKLLWKVVLGGVIATLIFIIWIFKCRIVKKFIDFLAPKS